MDTTFKKLPYGTSDFRRIRTENYAYVDKTRFIELLEREVNPNQFFIRPRKFGKSLFFTMLSYYYDINCRDEFDALFGDLYIGRHPTPTRNSFAVLPFDFSGLNTGSPEAFSKSFGNKIQDSVCRFFDNYKHLFPNSNEIVKRLRDKEYGAESLLEVYSVASVNNIRVFVIIDEYDHFANDLIALGDTDGGSVYRNLIRANGLVRDFYENLKMGAKTSVFYRTFITGISPVMLDDLTSGYNIGVNLSLEARYNEMLGFTRQEVDALMQETGVDPQLISIDLEACYNGYLFSVDGKNRVFNPSMALFLFHRIINTGKMPETFIDNNLKTDYGRLQQMAANENNRQTLLDIIKNGGVEAEILTQFSMDFVYDDRYFISLLFYMGLLTIRDIPFINPYLVIPNYSIKTLYWEYLEKIISSTPQLNISMDKLNRAIRTLAMDGKPEPFVHYVSQTVFKNLSDFDLQNFDEKYIKIMLLACLFQSKIYIPMDEFETVPGRADIFLQRNPLTPKATYEWLIEIKYSKVADSADGKAAKKKQGLEQLKKYCNSARMKDRPNLRAVLLHYTGKEDCEITVFTHPD
jgi:hypothetical protein